MTTRTVLFRLHWLLGLTAGLVLALVGVTGALLSYEEALTEWANADRAFVTASDAPRLSPAALKARVEAQQPGRVVSSLALWGDPERSPRIRFANDPAMGARPPTLYLDPVDGRTLGEMRLEDTFATIRKLHRWLLLPGDGKGWGRSITGICAIALLVFLATGLYLRWPKLPYVEDLAETLPQTARTAALVVAPHHRGDLARALLRRHRPDRVVVVLRQLQERRDLAPHR